MFNKTQLKPLAAAIGTTFAVSLAVSPVVNAAENPFSMTQHENGYMVAEGNCGEGKCGDKKEEEGKCGDKMKGDKEEGEGKCGDKMKDDMKEGEGKCGDKMKDDMKEGEGKCGS